MERASGTTEAQYSGAGVAFGGSRLSPADYRPLLSQRRSGASRFYHPSLLGTVEALTDVSGDTTDSYVLDAFGVTHALSGSTVNPHVFIGALGYYTDPLGPLYVRARWLRTGTGSWLSADPVLSEPRYQYVGGRASWGTDASGMYTFMDCWGWTLACLGLVAGFIVSCIAVASPLAPLAAAACCLFLVVAYATCATAAWVCSHVTWPHPPLPAVPAVPPYARCPAATMSVAPPMCSGSACPPPPPSHP